MPNRRLTPLTQPLTALPYSPSLDLTDLDRTADPCVDFYQYICGGWMKNNPIPADQASWGVYAKLENDNRQYLWGILEEDAKAAHRTPAQQKIGDYYAACMNTDAINARGLAPLQPELDRIAAISGSQTARRLPPRRRRSAVASTSSTRALNPIRRMPA